MNTISRPTAYVTALYTPAQTFAAALIGGPAAGAWTLSRNFRATSRNQAAWVALMSGLATCVVVAIIALKYAGYFALYHIYPVVVPFVYSFAALALAHVFFADTVSAHIQLGGRRSSWWVIAGVAIAGIIISLSVAALVHKISPAVDFL